MEDRVCGVELSRETFSQLDSPARDMVIFDCLKTISQDVADLKKQEKANKKEVMWTGGIFGFIGGLFVSLGKAFLP